MHMPKDNWQFDVIWDGISEILMAVGAVGLLMKAVHRAARSTENMSYAFMPPVSLEEYGDGPFEEN